MAYSTTNLYPEDLNGTNPLNLIKNEVHSLQVPGPKDFYFIIPHAAPFFVDSLKVINVATGVAYTEGNDYLVGHRFIEAMDSIGRPIAGSIRFMRRDIVGQVKLEYRTIGGQWGFSDQAIMRELTQKQYNPLVRSWGDIDVLPASFPTLIHDQPLNTLVGSPELRASLERIADVMEATASGTTQSHLLDYQNPHRTTAAQVQLGNVPNFAMANDIQSRDALRSDLFANPRGVLLAIQEHALKPLDAHINATGNVHGMFPADIGLGNVPNFPAATPTQAIDPTNNQTLLTPYTASLLVQKLSNDPRLDQLIIDFNNHLSAYNPHNITPGIIGTYTAQEIDQKIAAGGGGSGGDAATFGGETPDQWEDKFPMNDDINTMLQQTGDVYQAKLIELNGIDMTDPVTPGTIASRNAMKASWGFGGVGAYAIYNSLNDARVIASSTTKVGVNSFPTETQPNFAMKFASELNANYYINSIGAIEAWGTAVVPVPTKYQALPGFLAADASDGIWASKDYIWLLGTDAQIKRYNRTGTEVFELPADDVIDIFIGNGTIDPRPIGIAETGELGSVVMKPIGDANWKTAVNAAMASWGAQVFSEVRVGSEYVNFITYTGTPPATTTDPDLRVFYLRIYKINFGASITLTEVTNQIDIKNHTDGTIVKADTIRGANSVAGNYTHFVFTKPRANSVLCDLLSYGDNSQGQLEFPPSSAPFVAVFAGYQYSVTINQLNYVEFWGNSPDNSMNYRGGRFIPSPGTTLIR